MTEAREIAEKLAPLIAPAEPTDESPISSCPECRDTGYMLRDGVAIPCPRHAEERLERLISIHLPKRYRDAFLSDFSPATVAKLTAWLGEPGDGLLLTGPTGTGKTHMAAAMTRTCLEIGGSVLFCRAAELYEAIRATYDRQGFGEGGLLKRYEQVSLLVLDDLGSGALSDFERRYTLDVLDRRLNAMRPTVVTSNWDLETISERMDDRIASRLSSFTLLAFTGEDRRGKRSHNNPARNAQKGALHGQTEKQAAKVEAGR